MTVRVKLCVAFGATPLFAVIVIGYVPPVPAAGVPLNTPAAESVTPLGKVPVCEKLGAGAPVAVTLNDPAVPTVKVVALPLVIAGGIASNVIVAPLPATASLVCTLAKLLPLTVPWLETLCGFTVVIGPTVTEY